MLDLNACSDYHIMWLILSIHLYQVIWDRCLHMCLHLFRNSTLCLVCLVNWYLFSSGIHRNACLALLMSSMRCTWPNQHSHLFLTVVSNISSPVLSLTISFLALSFQVTLSILRWQMWWKAWSKRSNFIGSGFRLPEGLKSAFFLRIALWLI